MDFVIASAAEPQQVSALAEQIVQKAMTSGMFIFADTDVKFDQPQTEVVFDRDKLRSQGVDLSQAGQDLSTMLGGNYVNRFSIQGRSYKVIPQVKRVGAPDSRSALADLCEGLFGQARAALDVCDTANHDRAAIAEQIPAAECGADSGRDPAERSSRQGADLSGRPGQDRFCRRVSRSTTRVNHASCAWKAANSWERSCSRRC